MTLFGSKTIRAGERAAIWSTDGTCKLVDGPKKVRLVCQKLERLVSYTADANSYVVVRKNDGAVFHHPGPVSLFRDPVLDEAVTVRQAHVINASQALVVNKGDVGKLGTSQRIVRGPCRFVPEADELVHATIDEAIADANSYLEVRKRDGQVQIFPGPCSMFTDPQTDEAIVVRKATLIDASQALVVNRQRPIGGRSTGSDLSATAVAAADAGGNPSGVEQRLVRGPARFVPAKDEWVVQTLREYTADETSYMEVRKRAGPIEIVHGPTSRFLDPVLDESIAVKPATMIDASEALVVYQHSAAAPRAAAAADGVGATGAGGTAGVDRRIVRGPARFIPAADEWIHHFEWSGMPKDGSKTSYQPKALRFDKLKVIPMTAYHNVNEVRTNDDTLITIKLMLFYEVVDIERMLDATNDPIGDFVNAASSDVIAFCAGVSYETFLNETYKLNDLASFGQLVARAESIGYRVSKVVFRGFQAGAKLQAMHDDAIQERTRLRLLEETQAQEQRAADLRLAAEQQRATREAELQIEKARLEAEISLSQQKARLAEQALIDEAQAERAHALHERELAELRAKGEAELQLRRQAVELERAQNEEQLRVVREMSKLDVDVTRVLVAQHHVPGNLIRLETPAAAAAAADGGAAPTGGAAAAAGGAGKGLIGALQLNL